MVIRLYLREVLAPEVSLLLVGGGFYSPRGQSLQWARERSNHNGPTQLGGRVTDILCMCRLSSTEGVYVACKGDDAFIRPTCVTIGLLPPIQSECIFNLSPLMCQRKQNRWQRCIFSRWYPCDGGHKTHSLFHQSTLSLTPLHLHVNASREDARLCILSWWTLCQGR
jgi:hypothetical protein